MYEFFNSNPSDKFVGDCVVRAISKALNKSWESAYIELCIQGLMMSDMPSSNAVWNRYLKNKGFKRHEIEDCPECYSIYDFCKEHPEGVYIVGTGSHAVCICNGCAYDAWNSLRETPVYYFEKEN